MYDTYDKTFKYLLGLLGILLLRVIGMIVLEVSRIKQFTYIHSVKYNIQVMSLGTDRPIVQDADSFAALAKELSKSTTIVHVPPGLIPSHFPTLSLLMVFSL